MDEPGTYKYLCSVQDAVSILQTVGLYAHEDYGTIFNRNPSLLLKGYGGCLPGVYG
jgi:hypothetical protein